MDRLLLTASYLYGAYGVKSDDLQRAEESAVKLAEEKAQVKKEVDRLAIEIETLRSEIKVDGDELFPSTNYEEDNTRYYKSDTFQALKQKKQDGEYKNLAKKAGELANKIKAFEERYPFAKDLSPLYNARNFLTGPYGGGELLRGAYTIACDTRGFGDKCQGGAESSFTVGPLYTPPTPASTPPILPPVPAFH